MKDDIVFIRHILDEVNFLLKETSDLKYEKLIDNEVLKRAVTRSLEIIGEASKNVSKDFRDKHNEINWKELAGLRDKLIHYYFGINWKRVLDVLENLIPGLKVQVEAILKK